MQKASDALSKPSIGPTSVTVQAMHYLKPLASSRSPTALTRPDRSKLCHCLQFAKLIKFIHYVTSF